MMSEWKMNSQMSIVRSKNIHTNTFGKYKQKSNILFSVIIDIINVIYKICLAFV